MAQKPEQIREAILTFAATEGDIFDASSVVIGIAGIGGRADVEAARNLSAPEAAAHGEDPVLQRALFLLDELLRLRIWL